MSLSAAEWGQIEALLPEALSLPPAERAGFLRQHCADTPALQAELESLIAASESGGDILAGPVVFSAGARRTEPALAPGTRLGAWEIGEPIGRGGMGEVYAASRADGQFQMQAAVKILKRGLDSDALLARFQRERNILARLAHPNIARLLDGGVMPDGRPYYVMERVQGRPVTAYCKEQNLSLRQILHLMSTVCDGVDAAHRALIVHRDLKPSNVLVAAAGEVKLLDFGVAKLIAGDPGDSTRTELGGAMLTPLYAAPEQILGGVISPATDVYALGVILFELLTGALPHRRAGLSMLALVAAIRQETGERASRVAARGPAGRQRARGLSGDLDLILQKALHADPLRRYTSAHDLGIELRRFLAHRPVEARPDSLGYRVNRFLRRYPLPSAAAAIAMSALVTGLTVALWQAGVAREEARTARAISDFVTQDLLAGIDPNKRSTANITLKEMLGIATGKVDERFMDQPRIAAELHHALAMAYSGIDLLREGRDELEKAAALYERVGGPDSVERLKARFGLGIAIKRLGDWDQALAIQQDVLDRLVRVLGPDDPHTIHVQLEVASLKGYRGAWEEAIPEYRAVIRALSRTPAVPAAGEARYTLAVTLVEAARYDEAEQELRDALVHYEVTAPSNFEGRARVELELINMLSRRGKLAEAAQRLSALAARIEERVPSDHWLMEFVRVNTGLLLLEQDDPRGASAFFEGLIRQTLDSYGTEHPLYPIKLIYLAEAYQRGGRHEGAVRALREAIPILRKMLGADTPGLAGHQLALAESLTALNRAGEAGEALAAIKPEVWSRLPAQHPYHAQLARVRGLLLLSGGHKAEARAALAESLKINEYRFGSEHWRTRRARNELAGAH